MAEASIRQFVYHAGARKGIPVSGTFELTPRCNFRCQMCYIRMTPEEQSCIAPEKDTAWWLDIGRQAVDAGMICLLITGGEPFLRPDFVTIYTEMVKMGVLVSVNTNASCLTDEILDAFRMHPPAAVNVTLYGASPETYDRLCGVKGGFEAAVRGIDAMRAAGVRVYLNTTFTTCNAMDMEALVAFAQERHLPIRTTGYTFPPVRNGHAACDVCLTTDAQAKLNARFDFLTATPKQRADRQARLREAKARFCADRAANQPLPDEGMPVTCLAGRGSFWLTWNGQMYPCGMLSGQAASGDDFTAMWSQVRDMTAALRLPALCRNCVWRKLCPSCAAVCYSVHGDTSKPEEELCRYMQAFADAYIELYETTVKEGDAQITTETADSDEPGDSPFVCL